MLPGVGTVFDMSHTYTSDSVAYSRTLHSPADPLTLALSLGCLLPTKLGPVSRLRGPSQLAALNGAKIAS